MIKVLLNALNIKYKNIKLYETAFTHSTYANEKKTFADYQRLEFVGDAIIDMIVAEHLFKKYKQLSEGEFTQIRSKLVNAKKLAAIAKRLNMNNYIRSGNNKQAISSTKVISDVFESLVAAIYFDLGLEKVRDFLNTYLLIEIKNILKSPLKNAKTILQEHLQTESREAIIYTSKEKEGTFEAQVTHEGNVMGKGFGKTIKKAEQGAAIEALKKAGIKWD